MQQGELDGEEVMHDVQCLLGGDLSVGVGGQSLDLDVVLLGVGPYPVEGGFAQVDRAWPRPSASRMYSGTGRGSATGQVPGSRGVSRVKAWENVRAAASRAVSGSPRPHCSRKVAISEVCRCSWLNTSPSATHGETTMAGTR